HAAELRRQRRDLALTRTTIRRSGGALVERHGSGVTPALGGVKALPRNIPRRSDLTSCSAVARSLAPTGDARRHHTRVLERDGRLVARPRRERGAGLHEAAAHR